MLIQCEKCSTRYNLDEAKIPGKGAKVTCPSCKHVFIVMKGQGAPASGGSPTPTPPPAPAPPKSLLDGVFDDSKTVPGTPFGAAPAGAPGGRSIRSWKVRVASGLVYDFTDVATLKAWINEKKVTTADQISADGANWTVIGSIASLDEFFGVAPAPAPAMGTPGPPPATGFGGAAPGGPAAPAFASAPGAGGSLADLFNSPAPDAGGPADPFGAGAPAGPAADPFGGPPGGPPPGPFGGAPASPGANPFGGPPAPAPAANPFGGPPAPPPAANPFGGPPAGGDPFGAQPPGAAPNPFGAGAADPFGPPAAAPPPAPAPTNPFGADPFAAAPPASGANPFGGAAGAPFGDAPPPPMAGPAPAPPPWLSGPAPAPAPPAPAAPAAVPPPAATESGTGTITATARPSSWMSTTAPDGAKPAPIPTRPPRRIGRLLGIGAAAILVVGIVGGFALNKDRILTALRPVPTPVPTATPPPITLVLEGQARDHYLRGRRLLRMDTDEAYAQAETEFRAALAQANGNPRAAAGVLEALSLRKQAGAEVGDDALMKAHAEAIAALKEDPQALETNRALAQYYAVTGRPADALGHLETALATRPGDTESLFLRSRLRAADAAQAEAAAADLAAAAADATLTRAIAAKAEGTKKRSPANKALAALQATNAETLAAMAAGSWTSTPEELETLLPGATAPTPVMTASPVASAVADASPAATATADGIAAVTPTAVAATPTPDKTPVAAVSPKPTRTPLAAASATPVRTRATPRPTPVVVATPSGPDPTPAIEVPTPEPTPAGTQIATASAQDHFLAGQAYEMAGAWNDAIAEYKKAAKAAPKNTSYKLALASAELRAGKLQDAAYTLTDILEREPKNASAHRMLGLLFDTTGQSGRACAEFQEYLRLRPQAPDLGDIRTRMTRNGC